MKLYAKILLTGFCLSLVIGLFLFQNPEDLPTFKIKKSNKSEAKKARAEYFFNTLRDPKTNSIPEKIGKRESKFFKKAVSVKHLQKRSNSTQLKWKEAGPFDVAGRTRALH